MSLIKPNHKPQFYGSQHDIQILTSDAVCRTDFEKSIGSDYIEWLSPIKKAGFAEYRDEFPRLDIPISSLKDFWPSNGPQWDGIFIDHTRDTYVLVEAKAHLKEIFNSTAAKDNCSVKKIQDRLRTLAKDLRVKSFHEEYWFGKLYQMANRLAFLDFLNKNAAKQWRNKIRLMYLIFIDDPIADKYSLGIHETEEAWKTAIHFAKHHMLNIPSKNKLEKMTSIVFTRYVAPKARRRPDTLKGKIRIADDFNEPSEGFTETFA